MKYINRDTYLNKVLPYIDKQLIKVLVGQRRVGKSCIMKQVADYIKSGNQSANIIYVDKELLKFSEITDANSLNAYVMSHLKSTKNYLFVDEVQEISNFELCLRSLLNEEKCDIYCSESNAQMLSGELATHLSGRYIQIEVHSLSFNEFLFFNKLEPNKNSLRQYLILGGMPYLVNLPKEPLLIFEYLKNVYSTILLKDVVARESIRNISFMERLVDFIADNIGNLFSSKRISDYLKSQHIAITIPTIQGYLRSLCSAYIVYKVPRVDLKGMKIFEIGEKLYFEDLGIRNALRDNNRGADINQLMENAVFKELICRGYHVYIGKLGNREIDFVAMRHDERIYIQVAYLLADKKVIDREFGNLKAIGDDYPKYVVSMDEYAVDSSEYPGIKQIHLMDFLESDRW
jgi:predicted AAA+ superfamily ATPase